MTYPEKLEQAWRDAKAPRQAHAPTVISTFAGGGGSSTGYHMAGFRELLAIEWEENAVQTLRANYPGLDVLHADIAKVTVEDVLKRTGLAPGDLDVLDGSPPCQGFSTAGKRAIDDDRNQLFREFVRLLKGLQPKVFVMENVSGMVKGKMKLIFAEILRELRAAGYNVSARLLNAKHYGVPQSRERMIFIGVRTDLRIAPSHPVGSMHIIPLKAICQDAIACRSQGINPWIPASEPVCTITKTPYKDLIKTASGNVRSPTMAELRMFGSFPAKYQFVGQQNDGWMRIGNSVPPLLMRAIAQHIRNAILQRLSDINLEPRQVS